MPHTLQALNLLELDDIDGAIDAANRVRAQSDLVGVVSPVPLALGVTALGRFSLGRWDDAIADAEAIRSLHEVNAQGGVWINAILARIACHRGELDAAEGHLSAGEALLAAGAGGSGLIGF